MNVDLLKHRQADKQRGRTYHQDRSNESREVYPVPPFLRNHVNNAENRRAPAHREPRGCDQTCRSTNNIESTEKDDPEVEAAEQH